MSVLRTNGPLVMKILLVSRISPDSMPMPRSVVSHLGLFGLPMSHKIKGCQAYMSLRMIEKLYKYNLCIH